MRDVYLIGCGQTAVTSRQGFIGRQLAAQAIKQAIECAQIDPAEVGMLVMGNMMSGILSDQQQLGALCADEAGLRGVEAATVESACSSGGSAARWGFMSVAGGFHDVVVVCGLELMTHVERERTTAALATASDHEYESGCGETFISLNAHLMAWYMQAYNVNAEDFAHFSITAHQNAMTNPNALLKKHVDMDTYLDSRLLVDPVRLFDVSPASDGSAAVVLASEDVALSARRQGLPVVKVSASAIGTDSVGLHNRRDRLFFDGAQLSSQRAYEQAGITPDDIDIFELHDAFTIISVLSLEAAGFACPGKGVHFGKEGEIALDGDLPISTFGGLKARGHPVGATGVYQLAEMYLQLTDQAGANQVKDARVALAQNIGGTGSTVVSHILTRMD